MKIHGKSIKLASNRSFGLFFSFVFMVISLYFFYLNLNYYAITLTIIAITFLSLSFLNPSVLTSLNKAWMYFGFVLSLIVSPIILGFIFFVIFTPAGLLMRAFGRDELNLKIRPLSTNWKNRDSKYDLIESFKNQF